MSILNLARISTRHNRRRPATSRRRQWLVEPLENRALLSAISVLDTQVAEPAFTALAAVTNTTPRGYTPAQIRAAYSFAGMTFNGGSIQADGTGQTIAIVDAYNDPNIVNDLHVFDTMFGIADPPSFKVLNQTGGTALPATDAGWSEEIALDVEWAHAMAPGASIVLVEANSSSLTDLLTAVNAARNLSSVSVVSMSWGSGEFSSERQYDQYFTTPSGHSGVTFVASAGDSGAQATWPAISPNVLSVGGTTLSSATSETAWSGSGGGYSRYETEPTFQRSAQTSGMRTSPDVSFNANPNTGFAVYDSVATGGRSGWFEIGGTSAGAPQWAALVAIANQGRALAGLSALSGVQSNLYALSTSDFRDVTAGSNGYSAHAGYDLVTGRGSPIASAIVRDLVGNAAVAAGSSSGGQISTTTPTTNSTQPVTTQPAPTHTYYELVYWNHRWWLVVVTSPNAIEGGDSQDASAVVFATATSLNSATTPAHSSDLNVGSTITTVNASVPSAAGQDVSASHSGLLTLAADTIHVANSSRDRYEQEAQPPSSGRENDENGMPDRSDESDEESTSEGTAVAKSAGLVAAFEPGQRDAATVFMDEDHELGDMISAIAARPKSAPFGARMTLEECFAGADWLGDLPGTMAVLADAPKSCAAVGLGLLAATLMAGENERPGGSKHVEPMADPRYFNRVRRRNIDELTAAR